MPKSEVINDHSPMFDLPLFFDILWSRVPINGMILQNDRMDWFLGKREWEIAGRDSGFRSLLIPFPLGSIGLTSLAPVVASQGGISAWTHIAAGCPAVDARRSKFRLRCWLGSMLKVVTPPATPLNPSRTSRLGDGHHSPGGSTIDARRSFGSHGFSSCFVLSLNYNFDDRPRFAIGCPGEFSVIFV
jgi:hypothetical protein